MHSVCFFFQLYFVNFLNHLLFFRSVFKRGKATPMLGSFHASDIPEFFGIDLLGFGAKPDFIGTDALGKFSGLCMFCRTYNGVTYHSVNFANTGNPNTPQNPISLLSNVDWQPWSSSADHPMLTFLDPVPEVSITYDDFRVPEINMLNKLFVQFASGSLDTDSMNEAIKVNSDHTADTGYISRNDDEL